MTVAVCINVIKSKGYRIVFPVIVDTIIIDLVNRHSLLYKTHLVNYQYGILTASSSKMQFRLTWRTFIRVNQQLDCGGSLSTDT